MQARLSELYGLDLDYHINDFLITDRSLAGQLGASEEVGEEELLILEEDDAASVSLFLEQELMTRLERDNPLDSLNDRNLADFLVALEGVSHFTYFAFKASRDQAVTLLELELQKLTDTNGFFPLVFVELPVHLNRGGSTRGFELESRSCLARKENLSKKEQYGETFHDSTTRYCYTGTVPTATALQSVV